MDSREKIENTKKYKLLSHEGLPLSVLFQIKLISSFDLTGRYKSNCVSMYRVVELHGAGLIGSRLMVKHSIKIGSILMLVETKTNIVLPVNSKLIVT